MIKWSKGSGKLEDIPSLNTNTLTNKYCKAMHESEQEDIICKECYSYYMLKTFRKNCAEAWQRNSDLLREERTNLELPYVNAALGAARFHSHGELINLQHARHFIRIAQRQPDIIFSLWTKKPVLILLAIMSMRLEKKPKNLILIYSNPKIDTTAELPSGFDKVFNVVTEDSDEVNCTGKCKDCMLCYSHNDVDQVYEIKKKGS